MVEISVGNFSGAVTAQELQSFNTFATSLVPATDNLGNNWAQGHSGEQTKAMGLIYLISNEQATLDQMIRFCDAVLFQRNDLAASPIGQYEIWTGRVDPVWPNNVTAPIGTGGEQGDLVGHLASCAYLILKTKNLYNETVTIGDPYGYGETYLSRATKYLVEADYSMSHHILESQLDLSNDNKMYFAQGDPYHGGKAVPWNQQMMFNYAFQNLCDAHRILGDNSALLGKYKGIIVASLDWFFTDGGSVMKTDSKGNTVYDWGYVFGETTAEDSNHGSLDIAGFARAYISGDYNVTAAQMKTFANMFVDVMTLGAKNYAGRVDGSNGTGHAAPTTDVRSGYLFLAEFRSDAYESIMSVDLTQGGSTSSADTFSRFLWVKNQLNKAS
ncbi:hypothetical protein B7494_g984 [Chlorociboria aeruginascens]|nr:hypothetical protein B7494_g984 [Chlorociboria aeruginascens]